MGELIMQSFIDDAKKVIDTGAAKVAKTAGELYERSKIALAISGVQNDIDKLYREIGEMIYLGHCDNNLSLDSVGDKCGEIDAKKQQLEELKAQRATAKDAKICSNCGAEVTASSTFCAKCGERFE